jgi:hypothetical protein
LGLNATMTRTAKKRKTSWKNYQSDGQKKKSLYLGVFALGLIISLVLLGKLLSFVGALGQPFAPDGEGERRQYLWNFNSPISVVVKAKEVSVLSFNPTSESLTVVKIPDETYVQAAMGYGRWPVRSIYELGQSEKSIGADLLKRTFQSTLGMPLDGYLIFKDNAGEKGVDQIIEDLRSSPFNTIGLLSQIKTDLSLYELIKMMMDIRGVRFDKVNTLDLAQSQTTSWILLSDGRRALELNHSLLDKTLAPLIEDGQISQEGVSIAIYNSTDHPGLAEKASRMITNMGGRVVLTSVTEPSLEKSVIIGAPNYTYTRLEQVFAPNCLKKGCKSTVKKLLEENETLKASSERAQITIILGEDYFKQ